jgi:predicted nicotinamide N-methyase
MTLRYVRRMCGVEKERHVLQRGLDVSASGLFDFGSGNGLMMFATKKDAAAHGKRWGWPAKYVCTVFTRLSGGYAVAQLLIDTVRFLAEDGTVIEAPLIKGDAP